MRNADRAAEGIMVLEFILMAFLEEENTSVKLNTFASALECSGHASRRLEVTPAHDVKEVFCRHRRIWVFE